MVEKPARVVAAFRALERFVRGPVRFFDDQHEIQRFKQNGPYDMVFYAARPFQESFYRSTLEALPSEYRVAIVRAAGRTLADGKWQDVSGKWDVYYVSMHGLRGIQVPLVVTPQTAFSRRRLPEAPLRVHMPHSLVSLHMTYPRGVFAPFNVLFAAGAHHEAEYRAMYPKHAVYPIGYGRMDELRDGYRARKARHSESAPGVCGKQIVLAPSWHAGNLLELIGMQVIGKLLELGHTVVFRPHYRIAELKAELLERLRVRYGRHKEFRIEVAGTGGRSLFEADLLICDYSGVAFEYAFLTEKPVLFVDAPLKDRNPDWSSLGLEPIEIGLRSQLGEVVGTDANEIVAGAVRLLASPESYVESIRSARTRYCYNFESGAGRAAAAILDRLMKTRSESKGIF